MKAQVLGAIMAGLLAAAWAWGAADPAPPVAGRPQLRTTLRGHREHILCLAFSPDGKTLASADGHNSIRVWDVTTGKCMFTFECPSREMYSLALSPDGKIVAANFQQGRGAEAVCTVRLYALPSGKFLASLKTPSPATCLAFSPDGRMLATGEGDGSIQLWALPDRWEAEQDT